MKAILFALFVGLLMVVGWGEDTKNGIQTEYWENGQKKWEGNYKDGKKDGIWIGWHSNGRKMSKVNFKNDKQNGLGVQWHSNGQKMCEGSFKDGKRDGAWATWFEDGTEALNVTYRDGEIVFDFSETTKEKAAQTKAKDDLNLPIKPPASVVANKKEQELAEKKAEIPSSVELLRPWLAEKDKEKTAKAKTRFEEKTAKAKTRFEEIERQYGKIIAEAIDLNKLHRRVEGFGKLYYAPKQETPYSGWAKEMKSGRVGSLRRYKQGMKHGQEIFWLKNGQKRWEGTYKDGNLVTSVVWKPNGEKCPHTNLVDGNGVRVVYNSEDGTEIYRCTYENGERVEKKYPD